MQATECGYSHHYKTYGVVFFNGAKFVNLLSPLTFLCFVFLGFWDLDFGVSKSSFEYDHGIIKGIIKVSAK